MKRSRAILLILALAFLQTACVVIEDGEVGVSKSFGAISDDPVPQGVAFVVPVARQIETWNVKLQELKETAQVPSSEGLIVGLDTSLLFQVTAGEAPEIRKTVGTQRMVIERLVIPQGDRRQDPRLPERKPGAPGHRGGGRAAARHPAAPALQGEHRGQADRPSRPS
jgi:hypothetical protein